MTPGDVAIVIGVGGVGANALQGCRNQSAAHIIAVDTDEKKCKMASTFGATSATTSLEEAAEQARNLTNGQGADVAIITVGVNSGRLIGEALNAVRKAGTVVVTATGSATVESEIPVNLTTLPMYQKRIQGAIYGGCSPASAIPNLARLYLTGHLLLDELVTQRYPLSGINEGYADMRAGQNIRGVIDFSL